jgi:hypothetical protein
MEILSIVEDVLSAEDLADLVQEEDAEEDHQERARDSVVNGNLSAMVVDLEIFWELSLETKQIIKT